MKDGTEIPSTIQYKGHRFKEDKVQLRYHLTLNDGKIVEIIEKPEYQLKESDQLGFERQFETKNVFTGMKVILNINVSSIALESNVKTIGTAYVDVEKNMQIHLKISPN